MTNLCEPEAMTEKRYCEDCRHCTRPDYGDYLRNLEYSRCAITAPVTGLPFVGRAFNKPPFCSTARMDGQPCGPEGSLFEPMPDAVSAPTTKETEHE
jgi:hypothetical protein